MLSIERVFDWWLKNGSIFGKLQISGFFFSWIRYFVTPSSLNCSYLTIKLKKFSTILVNFQKLQKIFLLKFKILSYSLLISFYQSFSNKCHAITSKVLQLPNINNRFVFRFCLNEAKLNFGKKTTRYDFTRFSCNKTQVMFFLQKLWKPELKMILFFLLKTLILLSTKKVNKKIVKKTGHNMG